MKCDEVKLHLDDFIEGTLPDDKKSSLQEHLDDCAACNNEYKLLNSFILQAKYLKTGIKTPAAVLEGIYDELVKKSTKAGEGEKVFNETQLTQIKKALRQELSREEKEKEEKAKKKKAVQYGFGFDYKSYVWLFVVMVLCVAGYVLYDLSLYNSPWEIKIAKGEFKINGFETESLWLNEGDKLLTEAGSKLMVNIPNAGRFELDENSTITFIKGKKGDNQLFLNTGTISIYSKVFQPGITLSTNLVSISDPGSNYKVSIKNDSSTKVEVILGIVEINHSSRKLNLATGYICDISETDGMSIPYHKYAKEDMIKALRDFKFGGNITDLNMILTESTDNDALSLWHLLKLVSPNERLIVFEKLNDFFPIPAGVTKEGIIKLDEEMLTLWYEEIEWQL